jgi:hypothetical protein
MLFGTNSVPVFHKMNKPERAAYTTESKLSVEGAADIPEMPEL